MKCTNCGKELIDNANFCDTCGSAVTAAQPNVQKKTQDESVNKDLQENKIFFILSYFGILFFLPLVLCPNSKVGRFHSNQGLILLLTFIIGQVAISVLSSILLAISWSLFTITSLLSTIWAIAMFVLMIIGIINANRGEQKPLPFIGEFTIIK